MADTRAYLDYITKKRQKRERIENVDFSKMPAGVDVMAVAEELGRDLPDSYRNEIMSRATKRGQIKALDYNVALPRPAVQYAEPGTMPQWPPTAAPTPGRPDVPAIGMAPSLPTPTPAEISAGRKTVKEFGVDLPKGLGKAAAGGLTSVVSGGVEGFGNIAGALGALDVEADSKTVSDFVNAFSQRHLQNEEKDILYDIASGLGSTLPFMGIGRAVAGGVRVAGALAKTQKGLDLAAKLGTVLGVSSIAVTNAMVEGGAAAQELRYEGKSRKTQDDAFWRAFFLNVPLTAVLNRWMIGDKAVKNRLAAFLQGGRSEAAEETLQNFISKLSQGKPVDLGEALYEGGIGAIVGGGMATVATPVQAPAPAPLPGLPLSPNLDEATKARAGQMAQTDPVAAMKLVVPASEWQAIDRMAGEIAEAAEADASVPAAEKRMAVQAALTGVLQNSLAPAAPAVTGAEAEGVAPGMPAPAVPVDPQVNFMRTQVGVLRMVSEKMGLDNKQISDLVLDKARDGVTLRQIVQKGIAEGKTPEQMADEYGAFLEGIQRTAAAQAQAAPAPTPLPEAEKPATAPTAAPEAAPEAVEAAPAGRWSDIADAKTAAPGMAVAALDMTDEGAGAVILKTADNRFVVRSEFADVQSEDPDGFFPSVEAAKAAIEAAVPTPGVAPAEMAPEAALPVIEAAPGRPEGRPDLPEAALEYEAQREEARAANQPVYEPEVETPDFETVVPTPEAGHPAALTYEAAKGRFKNLTPEQHKALVRGRLAAGQVVPEEVMAAYPDLEAESRAQAEEAMRREEGPAARPLLDLIVSRGYINRANYEKHWAGELPRDDMRFYIRKNGKATVSQLAEAAAEAGIIPEASENALFEAVGKELRGRAVIAKEAPASFLAEPAAPVFYSKLQATIAEKMSGPMSADQLRALVKNAAIKQEELDWYDLDGFLEKNPKPSKADVLDYLAANELKITEIVKGEAVGGKMSRQEALSRIKPAFEAKGYTVAVDEADPDSPIYFSKGEEDIEFADLPEDLKAAALQYENRVLAPGEVRRKSDTRYGAHVLPGGENYREVLFTLPVERVSAVPADVQALIDEDSGESLEAADNLAREKYGMRVEIDPDTDLAYVVPMKGERLYQGPHWSEDNVLAHLRLNDRTVDGKRTLFIEEVQSDWHQAGREKGYKADVKKRYPEIMKKIEALNKKEAAMDFNNWSPEKEQEHSALKNERDDLYDLIRSQKRDAVADAPFKKTWHEFVMKRALRMAVDEGYDVVAWTTGAQQADRYNLGKHVDSLEWTQVSGRSFDIRGIKNGKQVIVRQFVREPDLPGLVGKEVSAKIIAARDVYKNPTGKPYDATPKGELSGADLQVGGQGMAGFYDKMLPDFVNKFTKKWGGKVGQTQMDISGGKPLTGYEPDFAPDGVAQIHTLAITPEMRRAAMSGFPLFEPGHKYTQDELFPTELEAFTEPPAKAEARVIDDIKKVKPVGQFHDLRLDKAAKRMEKDFKERGVTRFVGQKIETLQDVAEIAAVYRHPFIEHAQFIFIKDGKFVGSQHFSSGLIDEIRITEQEVMDAVAKGMTEFGADGFYMSHNHPSGNPSPSDTDVKTAGKLGRNFGDSFKGSLVTDHSHFVAIDTKGEAILHAFKEEKPRFRKGELEPAAVGAFFRGQPVVDKPGSAADFSRGVLDGRQMGIMFLDVRLAVLSFDHVDPSGVDVNKYIEKMRRKYGAATTIMVTGDEGFSKMKKTGVIGGVTQDLVVLSADGSYKSVRLGNIPGWRYSKMQTQVSSLVGEAAPQYGAPDRKALRRMRPGAKLTARGRINDPSIKGGIPRGASVTVVDVDPSTGQMVVDYEGALAFAGPEMFRETYQKPEPVRPVPGIPVKRAVERATGVKPVERPVETTEMRLLNAKLATEEKAARLAAKAVKAELLEDMREAKRGAESLRKSAVEYIGKNVPKALQYKFVQMAANAKTVVGLAKVVVRADAEADKAYRRGLVDDIKKVSDRALSSMRVDVEYREAVKALLTEFDVVKRRPDTILKLKALQEYVNKAEASGKDIFLPDEMRKRLEILTLRPLDEMSNAELENALRDLHIIEAVGREGQAQKEAAWEMEKGEWRRSLAAAAKPLTNLSAELSKAAQRWAWAQEVYWSLAPMNVLFDRLDGGKGDYSGPHSRMKAILDADFFRFLDLKRRHIGPVLDLVDKHGMGEGELTRIGIYAFKVQKDGVDRVLSTMPELTREFVERLTLTGPEMEVYRAMRENMEALYPEMKRLMGRLYNREVGKVENYFSMMTDWDKLMDMEVLERLAASPDEFTGMRKNITAGFSKERKPRAKTPIRMNAGQVFIQHMTDLAYFVAMQENIKKFSEIVSSEEYVEAAGPTGAKITRGWLDLLARQGKAEGSKRIAMLDTLRVNIGSAVLGFKLSSFLIQTTSFMDGAALTGGANMTQALSYVLSDKQARSWLLANFPKLRERVGDDVSFRDLAQTEWLKKIQTMGYIPLKWLDGIMATTTTLAGYMQRAKENGVELDFTAAPDKVAAKHASWALDRTQASPFFIDVGVAFNSPKFLFGNVSVNKALLQFKQFVINRWFFMSYDVPRLESTADKASAYGWLLAAGLAEMGVRGASRGIVLSALGAAGLGIASAVKGADDDDDMWRNYALTLLGMVPFLDAPMSAMRYGSFPIPVLDTAAKAFTNSGDAINAQNGYRRVTGLRKALTAFASLAGIPGTAQVGQILAWSYNPKTLTFPYSAEYWELVELGHTRTAGETARLRRLDAAKGRFSAYAKVYRDAMQKGDIEAAAGSARRAADALEGL